METFSAAAGASVGCGVAGAGEDLWRAAVGEERREARGDAERRPRGLQGPSPSAETCPIRIVSVNATAAGSLKTYLAATDAHIVLAQEVKTSSGTSEQLKGWAKNHAWRVLVADAVYCPTTKAHRAGVAVFVREWMGLGWPPGAGPIHFESRAIVAMVECPGLPAFLVASAYLKTGIGGAAPYNLKILEFIGQTVGAHRLPWVLGGDFQMTPQDLADTSFPEAAGARIVADLSPVGTCTNAFGASIIDFFVMSEDFADVVGKASTILDANTAPHRPVQVVVPANAGQMTKLAITAVQKLPNNPVYGPRPAPPNWEDAACAARKAIHMARTCPQESRVKHELAVAYRAFAETLEEEMADIAGVELRDKRLKRGRKIRTRWIPLLGTQKQQTSPEGVALRWMARRATELNLRVRVAASSPPAGGQPATISAWEAVTALCNVAQPGWMPPTLADDYNSLVELAKHCAEYAKAACVAGQESEEQDELPPLQQRAEELGERATSAEAVDAQDARKAWKLWVKTALYGGGRKAHQWVKGPQTWTPLQVVVDGVHRVAPQALLQTELVRCTKLWGVGRPYSKEQPQSLMVPPAMRQALPRLTPEQIEEAGLASPPTKATSYDGIHPRHVGLICREGRMVAAALWEACELASTVPPQIHDVAAPLIPKKNGKLRDLGLFAGLIRTCTKARNDVCRQWEAQNDRSFFACGTARSTMDVVWRAAVRAEGSHAEGHSAAAVLEDMEAFYQAIGHQRLLQQAELHGFSLILLRLAIHMYRGPRHLMLGRSVAAPARPTKGAVPGCTFACTLVKVYYLSSFDQFVIRRPLVLLDVFVDDLQVAAQGTDALVLSLLTEATADLGQIVENELLTKLVPAKAAVVASSSRLASRLRTALGQLAGAPVDVTEALGIDFAAGRARREHAASSKIKKRICEVAKRRSRIKVMSKFGGKSARKLIVQGANPASLYGVAVTGVTESLLVQVRRTAACGVPPYASGRSLDCALQLAKIDPGPIATGAPLVRWAQEVWQATTVEPSRAIGTHALVRLWNAVHAQPPKGWAQCRGPIGAAILSAKRLQWDIRSPYKWINDRGLEIDLTKASPKLVEWHVKQSWERLVSARIAQKLQAQGYDTFGSVDFTPARQVIESKAHDQLTLLQKGALRAVVCDAVWPKDRLIEAGYPVSPMCELCDSEADSMFHRLWMCTAVDAERNEVAPQRVINEARALGATSATYCRGLCQDLAEAVPEPLVEGGIRFMRNGVEIKDHTGWALEGNVFYDGSCLQRGCNGLSRATWAAVQLGPDNQVVASVSGPVWRSLPQTAQAAEHCARAAAVQILKGPARLIGDSRNIVAAANKPRQFSCHHSKMHAAASRVAADAAGADHVLDDTWVRAHRKPEDEHNAWDRYTAIGNGLADAEAVEAQTRLEHASTLDWQRVEAMQAKMRIICRTIGTIAALWPAARQSCGLVERQPGIAAPAKVPMASTTPHNWAHDGSKWVCTICITFAHDDAHQARRRHEHCPGYCAQLAKVLSGRWGHALAAVDTEGAPFVICLRCGAWGASNPTHLLAKCPQVLYPGGKQAFKRIAKQTHPSYYGTQPKIVAVVPFAVNEQLAQQIRSREPAKRVNAPLVTAAAASTHGERGGEREGHGRLMHRRCIDGESVAYHEAAMPRLAQVAWCRFFICLPKSAQLWLRILLLLPMALSVFVVFISLVCAFIALFLTCEA